jgi:hypothetical protein
MRRIWKIPRKELKEFWKENDKRKGTIRHKEEVNGRNFDLKTIQKQI